MTPRTTDYRLDHMSSEQHLSLVLFLIFLFFWFRAVDETGYLSAFYRTILCRIASYRVTPRH